ncbi:MAG: ABC transporter ATP-binding protein [Oscillospiraceae bacterium]
MENLLEIKNMSVTFLNEKSSVKVIDDLSFSLAKGEVLGIVGESGSGKSVTSLAVMKLLIEQSSRVEGIINFEGTDLNKLSEKEMQSVRGNQIAMIFQEPMTSLNPIQPCGKQIMESLLLHKKLSKKEAKQKAMELLTICGIPAPEQRFNEYPHQMSGGMRQRIMIAIALACGPKLLIADEPTTALDVTIQAQILDLMKHLKEKIDMSIMMITHDLGIVVDTCDRVIIMYTGQIVESAAVRDIFKSPKHPYTKGLINAIPKLDRTAKRLEVIEGMVPDSDKMPQGCHFNPRCPYASDRCRREMPPFIQLDGNRSVRCFLFEDEGKGENTQ